MPLLPQNAYLIVIDYNDSNGVYHSQHVICLFADDVRMHLHHHMIDDDWSFEVYEIEDGRLIECTESFPEKDWKYS